MDDADAEAEVGGTAKNPALSMTQVEADHLNDLWQRVRQFLNGKDDDGNQVEH